MRTDYYLVNTSAGHQKYFWAGHSVTPKGVMLYFYYGRLPGPKIGGTCLFKQRGPMPLSKAESVLEVTKQSKLKQQFQLDNVPSGVRQLIKQTTEKTKKAPAKSKQGLYYHITLTVGSGKGNEDIWSAAKKASFPKGVVYQGGNTRKLVLAASNPKTAKDVFDILKKLMVEHKARRRSSLVIHMSDPISNKLVVLTKYGVVLKKQPTQDKPALVSNPSTELVKPVYKYFLFANKSKENLIGSYKTQAEVVKVAADWANQHQKSCFIFTKSSFYGEYLPDKLDKK